MEEEKKKKTKKKIESLAQLEQESGSTEPVEREYVGPNPHMKKPPPEEKVTITLPRHPSTNKPIVLHVNHREYSGTVTVESNLGCLLREMGEKVVERERQVTIGKKFEGTGRGARGMRQSGSI